MPLFRCMIRGENFPGRILGQEDAIGFYTTRFVEADSAPEAEVFAVELLRSDDALIVPGKYKTIDAKIYLEIIDEVPPETERKPNKGFTFFTMGT